MRSTSSRKHLTARVVPLERPCEIFVERLRLNSAPRVHDFTQLIVDLVLDAFRNFVEHVSHFVQPTTPLRSMG